MLVHRDGRVAEMPKNLEPLDRAQFSVEAGAPIPGPRYRGQSCR